MLIIQSEGMRANNDTKYICAKSFQTDFHACSNTEMLFPIKSFYVSFSGNEGVNRFIIDHI